MCYVTSSTSSDKFYTISEAEHNRECRRAELQLAIAKAIDKKLSSGSETAFGSFTKQDVAYVLARMVHEWIRRLPQGG